MIKRFFSDFGVITKQSQQDETFAPYFSMMLTVITITIVGYGLQTVAFNFYTYLV